MEKYYDIPKENSLNSMEGIESDDNIRFYNDSPLLAYTPNGIRLDNSDYEDVGYRYLNGGKRIEALRCFLLSSHGLISDVAEDMKLTESEFDEAIRDATNFIQAMPKTLGDTKFFHTYFGGIKNYYANVDEAEEDYEAIKEDILARIKTQSEFFKKNFKFAS